MIGFLRRFVPETNSSTLRPLSSEERRSSKASWQYRYQAVSIDGFVEQLVRYVNTGHYFYVTGCVPVGKLADKIDQKLLSRYGIAMPRWERARRKQAGCVGSLPPIRSPFYLDRYARRAPVLRLSFGPADQRLSPNRHQIRRLFDSQDFLSASEEVAHAGASGQADVSGLASTLARACHSA